MKKIIVFVLALYIIGNSLTVGAVNDSALSSIVINGKTRSIIYSKNSCSKLPMASTTKIMTALILAEYNTPEKEVTVTAPMVAVEGSSMGLRVGDIVTYNDLMYGILLCSGNDAANTVAMSICGSTQKFAELMNNKAAELGLKNTHFVTPSGLDADGHYTTAYDLALLASFALENEYFKQVAATKSILLNYGGSSQYLSNHNKLLKIYDGAVGVKTGYTSKAGRCLVSAAERDGIMIIAVTLNDRDDWNDHINLLDFGFEKSKSVMTEFSCPESISCIGSEEGHIKVSCENIPIGISNNDKLDYITYLPRFVYADILAGEKLGYAEVYSNGYKILTLDILADESTAITQKEDSKVEKIIKLFLILLRGL